MAEFIIRTDVQNHRVDISIDDDAEFIDWMMACEFLMTKTAQLSLAGYEKALELLCKGSMDYKVVLEEYPNGC
jgi:hypothetical protein